MKTLSRLMLIASILLAAVSAQAGMSHEHDQGGPRGGRFLEKTEPRAEFFVEKDLSVTITFYDPKLKPVAVNDQSVSVIAKSHGKKTTLAFEKKGDVLVSKGSLPKEHAIHLVVQFKQTPSSKTRNFRFVYEDHICGTCKRAEYACVCKH